MCLNDSLTTLWNPLCARQSVKLWKERGREHTRDSSPKGLTGVLGETVIIQFNHKRTHNYKLWHVR